MKWKSVVLIAGILIATLLAVSCAPPPCPEVGQKASDFTLATPDGQQASLSDYKGKLVMVNFWSMRCGPCVSEMPHLQEVYNDWSSQELAILAVNVSDSASAAREFISSTGVSFDILLDPQGEVPQQYCLQPVIPITLFIDREGILRKSQIGAFRSADEINAILESL